MRNVKRSEEIQRVILDTIPDHPKDVVARTAAHFGLSRQAVNRHVNTLMKLGMVQAKGNTRQRVYRLNVLHRSIINVPLKGLEEDKLWREKVRDGLINLSENVFSIWHYGFTEMVNNAIDHSGGNEITVIIEKTAATVHMLIIDDGVGIFKKIKEELGLEDERHAILELAKGKLTTDPHHQSRPARQSVPTRQSAPPSFFRSSRSTYP